MCFSADFVYPEHPENRLNDYAHLLSLSDKNRIETELARFEANKKHQAVIAIFDTINDLPIEEIATKLFEKWKLGTKKDNNGILLILAIKQKKIRIEVGYGLESILTDTLSKRIINENLTPYFKQNDYAQGLMSYIEKIDSLFLADGSVNPKKIQKHDPMVLLFWTFLIMIFLYRLSRRFNGNGLGRGGNAFPPFIILGSGGFGNHNRWGGGGGGLSGGGGASGDW